MYFTPLRSGVRIGANSSITISLSSHDAARFGGPLNMVTGPFGCNSADHYNLIVDFKN